MSDIDKVKQLRQSTGAGFKDCNLALKESSGDIDKAIEILRIKGISKASKKMSRDAKEGVIATSGDVNKTSVIEINCETDFVAKNESYLNLANALVDKALNHESLESFLKSDFSGMTVSEKLIEQTGLIGEKIEIGGFKTLQASFVGYYIHAGNKIAALTGLSLAIDNAAEISKNVAMQAAAMNPIALNEEGVDSSIIEKEIEIAKDQLRQEGKPEAMLDNIAKGKIKRFFKDNTLVNQDYIKDGKQSVKQYVSSFDQNLKVTGFSRLSLV